MSSKVNSSLGSQLILLWCTSVAVGCVAIGTLLPFSFDRGPAGVDQLFGLSQIEWQRSSASDLLTNLLVYLPVGATLTLVMRRRAAGRDVFRILLALGLAVSMSIALEWAQTMMTFRVASWVDVCMNGLGALVGAAAVSASRIALPIGVRLLHALRLHPFSTAAGMLTIGLVVYHLLPFDFVTSSTALWASLRESRTLPLQRTIDPETWVACAGYAGQFAILGCLCVLGCTGRGRRLGSSVGRAFVHVGVVALIIEALQLFVVSHTFDVLDLTAGALGGLLGATAAGGLTVGRVVPSWRGVLGVLLAGQVAYLWIQSAAPFDLSWDHIDPSRIISLPFWGYFLRPFGNAVAAILETAITFAVLSGIVWFVLTGLSVRVRAAAVLITAVGVSSVCEGLQMLTASHYADVTNPLVAFLAAVAIVILVVAPPFEWDAKTAELVPVQVQQSRR